MQPRRPFTMRRSSLGLATTMVAIALVPTPQPASASCAGPYLEQEERLVLERRTTATIEGRSFVDGCQDTMSCTVGLGCDSCEYDEPPPKPMEDVGLRLVQRERSWRLAVADAGSAADNRMGWVTWTFDVPARAEPGWAQLVAEHAEPVRIRIR